MRNIFPLLAALMILGFVSADVGPKPSMGFRFVYETSAPVSVVGAELIQCKDELCSEGEPLRQAGPQGIRCNDDYCSSIAYGYAPYQKLVANFSDGTRESNVFSTGSFNAEFEVRVTDTGLVVSEGFSSRSRLPLFLVSLALTLVIEVFITLLYVLVTKKPIRILFSVFFANLVSLPVLWFLFPTGGNVFVALAAAETFAVCFEAYFLLLSNPKAISFNESLLLSLAMNAISLSFGGFIVLFLSFLF